jgi:hypothetical protein
MSARWIATLALGLAGLAVASAVVLARQQGPVNQPGMPTPARLAVTNRGREEAIPVVVQAGGDVQPVAVLSAPALLLSPDATVGSFVRRQAWEYRLVTARTVDELTAALNKAGTEMWDAVGAVPGPAGAMQVLLKRPRP